MVLPMNKASYPLAVVALIEEQQKALVTMVTTTTTTTTTANTNNAVDGTGSAGDNTTTSTTVDLRRVYTMPARGRSPDIVIKDEEEDNFLEEDGRPSPTSIASRCPSKVVLRHSKSDGDATEYSMGNPAAKAAAALAAASSSRSSSGASSPANLKNPNGTSGSQRQYPDASTPLSPSTPAISSTKPSADSSSPDSKLQAQQKNHNKHKVDRFGFIKNMDSHGKINGADYCSDDDSDDDPSAIPTLAQAQRAERRLSKWQAMLLRGDVSSSKKKRNRKLFGFVPVPTIPKTIKPPSFSPLSKPPPPISSLNMGTNPTQFYAQENAPKHLYRNHDKAGKPQPKRRDKKLIRRARKGIPDSLRGRVWAHLLADVGNRMDQHEGLYDRLVRETIVEEEEEDCNNNGANSNGSNAQQEGDRGGDDEKIRLTKSFRNLQDTIERDIHRTFPRHEMFFHQIEEEQEVDFSVQSPAALCGSTEIARMILDLEKSNSDDTAVKNHCVIEAKGGQASLRRVLKAYSLYDREIGYCQGMNFIVGMFLTLMSEEEAFWLLVYVMFEEPCRMRGLFGEGMAETHQVLYVAEKLIQQFLPKLAQHLEREHVHITMFATQWLLTQYTSSFKFDLVLRVWDCFLTEGWKITYRVMLALLMEWQSDILKMSFEEILAFFRELPNRVDGGSIVDAANKIPLRRKHITKYEKEWISSQQQQQG